MADLARKMPESSHLAGLSVSPIDLANEKHYSVIEVSKLWALSQKTVRRIFEREPGVIHWGSERLATSAATGLYGSLRRSCFAFIESCDERAETTSFGAFKHFVRSGVASGPTSCLHFEGQSRPCERWPQATLVAP
jgi:hypothetical protein